MHEGHWGIRSMICSMSNVNHMHEGHRGIRSMICSTYNVNHMHGGKANKRCKCIMWIICIKGIEEYEVCYMIWALKNTRYVIWYGHWRIRGMLYDMQNEVYYIICRMRIICTKGKANKRSNIRGLTTRQGEQEVEHKRSNMHTMNSVDETCVCTCTQTWP